MVVQKSKMSNRVENDIETPDAKDSTDNEESPVKRKRGRPKKLVEEKPAEEPSDGPVVKRKRGRPIGSKNKNPKPKPVKTGPPRPRGRPRKWPAPDATTPKRGRGRPKKVRYGCYGFRCRITDDGRPIGIVRFDGPHHSRPHTARRDVLRLKQAFDRL
ncbi:hypothetical protein QZH41_020069, partial [Actinostola sp. cb2023]